MGHASHLPSTTRDPERPEWPDNGIYRALVTLEEPGVLDVAAGSYWLVSPAGGRIHLYP